MIISITITITSSSDLLDWLQLADMLAGNSPRFVDISPVSVSAENQHNNHVYLPTIKIPHMYAGEPEPYTKYRK